jgi:phospholipid/cholesterol/gamma-HCH transport system permease protein
MPAPPRIEVVDRSLVLGGEIRIGDAARVWEALRELAARAGDVIDLSGASVVDGAIMSLLVATRDDLASRGIESHIVGATPAVQRILHLYRGDAPAAIPHPEPTERLLGRLGGAIEIAIDRARRMTVFLGDVVASVARTVYRPASVNWRALPDLVERAGADGVPIVLLLNFLVGFVMAFQSARQLKLYGANVFVADVVGISVTRELAPLMTAIIMSGRSGAAFAAELATMRVSEEIDALRTMGLSPAPYLILPRILALALVAPVLTLLGDVVGVAGGAAVAASSLDVSPRGYVAEVRDALVASDVWTGLVKSVAFGVCIAFIGCQHGFSTRGAAAEVGRSTTATVVTCLFTIVVVDTVFTLIFRTMGR